MDPRLDPTPPDDPPRYIFSDPIPGPPPGGAPHLAASVRASFLEALLRAWWRGGSYCGRGLAAASGLCCNAVASHYHDGGALQASCKNLIYQRP